MGEGAAPPSVTGDGGDRSGDRQPSEGKERGVTAPYLTPTVTVKDRMENRRGCG